jgi:dienelactone hydrolase
MDVMLMQRVPGVGLYLPRIAAAVQHALEHHEADGGRLGLIGLSLGGGLVLDYAESAPAGQVKVLIDFFGYISATSRIHASAITPAACHRR